jgi:hypothetical protein
LANLKIYITLNGLSFRTKSTNPVYNFRLHSAYKKKNRFFTLKYIKSLGGWGSAPHPTAGVYAQGAYPDLVGQGLNTGSHNLKKN